MKAEELMVGDLVRVSKAVCIKKGTVVEIRGIDADMTFPEKPLIGCAACVPVGDPDGVSCGVWLDYLEPIPLTKEILELNGFTKQDFDGWEYMEPDDNGSSYLAYRILWRTDYDNHLFIKKITGNAIGGLQVLNVNYVHQLQQALRIFGINKDIKL